MCKYNSYTKKPESKTAFILKEGSPIFTESLYLIQPLYVHGRSPAFSLVSKGKHVSGFYPACGGAFIGDFQKKALIIFIRSEGLGFDLFQTDLDPIIAKAMLNNGELNDQLFKARQEAWNRSIQFPPA